MSKVQSVLSGSLIFSKQGTELSRIVPGPDAVTVTGSLHITGSRLTLNGSDLELRINTLEQSAVGDINIGGLLNWSGSINTFTSSVNNLTGSITDLVNLSGSLINSGSISGSVLTLHTVSGSSFDILLPSSSGGISTLPGGVVSSSAQISELGFVTGSPLMSTSLSGSQLVFTNFDNTSSIVDLSSISTNVETGSLVDTGSFNTLTGSVDRLTLETGSYLNSGSISGSILRLHTVSGSTLEINLPLSSGSSVDTGSFVTTSSFNDLTSSVDNLTNISGSFVVSGSILSGSTLLLYKEGGTTLELELPSGGSGSYNGITSSLNRLTSETGSYLRSGSISGSNLLLHTVSGSFFTVPLPDSVNTGSFVTTSSLNNITSSFTTTSSFNELTGSVNNLTNISGSLVNSGSISGSILKLHTISGSTLEITLPSGGSGSVDTGSLLVTASISSSFIVFEKGDASTFSLELPSAFPFTGSAEITGSLNVIGTSTFDNQVVIEGDTTVSPFIITSSYIDNKKPLEVNSQGVFILGEQLTTPTPVEGGVMYSASTFYFGFK